MTKWADNAVDCAVELGHRPNATTMIYISSDNNGTVGYLLEGQWDICWRALPSLTSAYEW